MSPPQLMMTIDKKGVFQITGDLKSLQIKNQILQNVNSKWYLKNLRFNKIFCLTILFSDPFTLYNSKLGLLLNPISLIIQ